MWCYSQCCALAMKKEREIVWCLVQGIIVNLMFRM
uniref:Uncharacterized protein n=1 Tax=Anguilla anguilla TaxID=7936 RepID=A0A0E9Q0I5_ANGAN